MVPLIAELPGLVAVKLGTLPVPPVPKPIPELLLVHENVPPAGTLVKLEAGTVAPAQTVTFGSAVTVGLGYTVMV